MACKGIYSILLFTHLIMEIHMAELQLTEKHDMLMNKVKALVKAEFGGCEPESVTFYFSGYQSSAMAINFESVTFCELDENDKRIRN